MLEHIRKVPAAVIYSFINPPASLCFFEKKLDNFIKLKFYDTVPFCLWHSHGRN
jgi:hypothetical protein